MKAAEESGRMKTDDSLADIIMQLFSVTDMKVVAVACAALKPKWLRSWGLFWVRNRQVIVYSMFKNFHKKGEKSARDCLSVSKPNMSNLHTKYVNIQ